MVTTPKFSGAAAKAQAAAAQAAAARANAVYTDAYEAAQAEQAAAIQAADLTAASDATVRRQTALSGWIEKEFDPTDVTYVPTSDLTDLEVAVQDTIQGMIVSVGNEVEKNLPSSQASVADTEQDRDTPRVNFRTIYLESMVNVILFLVFLLSVLAVVSVGMIIHKVVYTPPPPPPEPPVSDVSEVHTTTSALTHMARTTIETVAQGFTWCVVGFVFDQLADGNSGY